MRKVRKRRIMLALDHHLRHEIQFEPNDAGILQFCLFVLKTANKSNFNHDNGTILTLE